MYCTHVLNKIYYYKSISHVQNIMDYYFINIFFLHLFHFIIYDITIPIGRLPDITKFKEINVTKVLVYFIRNELYKSKLNNFVFIIACIIESHKFQSNGARFHTRRDNLVLSHEVLINITRSDVITSMSLYVIL